MPVTAALEETPKAKATKATRIAIRPQAPVTESQATAGAAKDKVAKGQAKLKTHGAGIRVPEVAWQLARPERGPAWETVKATAPAKRNQKAVLAAVEAASA